MYAQERNMDHATRKSSCLQFADNSVKLCRIMFEGFLPDISLHGIFLRRNLGRGEIEYCVLALIVMQN